MTTIVICYAAGTERVLRACLSSLGRHDAGEYFKVKVYTDPDGLSEAASYCSSFQGTPEVVQCPEELSGSRKHGFLLDEAMRREKGIVLTLDSDCFPVADGWLGQLVGKYQDGIWMPGIQWPWEPPSPTADKESIEWRIRNVQNWSNTWVVCQLVDTMFVRDCGLSYMSGDDTGFAIIEAMRSQGYSHSGFMPTRCARPTWASGFDPEMNRHMCVIYGDCMIHLGGGSAEVDGKEFEYNHLFAEPIEMTLRKASADWLLNDDNSHRYRFDNEKEVSAFKMRMMRKGILKHLQDNKSMFDILH